MSDKLGSTRSNPVSLPEANVFTVTLFPFLLFLKMQTCTLTFSYSFFFPSPVPVCVFLLGLALCFCLALSGIRSKEIHLFSLLSLCGVFFFIPVHFLRMFSFLFSLFLCYTFLDNSISCLRPSTSPSRSVPSLSFLPSPAPAHPVLGGGNEKCMYSVAAAECGSRRENCCFMVLFMDL